MLALPHCRHARHCRRRHDGYAACYLIFDDAATAVTLQRDFAFHATLTPRHVRHTPDIFSLCLR